ncbi:MAG: hypothetical protein MI784_12550 [Cytophagales bacterium]|nr:hypothetical protein [Cytophagales bacterium]
MRGLILGILFLFFCAKSQAQKTVRVEYTSVKEYGLFGQKDRQQKVVLQIDSLQGRILLQIDKEPEKVFKVAYIDHYEVVGKYCEISVHATRENVMYSFKLLVDDALPEESETLCSVVFNGTENKQYKFLGGVITSASP